MADEELQSNSFSSYEVFVEECKDLIICTFNSAINNALKTKIQKAVKGTLISGANNGMEYVAETQLKANVQMVHSYRGRLCFIAEV